MVAASWFSGLLGSAWPKHPPFSLHSPSFLLPHVAGSAAFERVVGGGAAAAAAAAAAESRNNECVVEGMRVGGAKTSCSLFTHWRINRNMNVYTRMMSDFSHACLFLPSLWVFSHSAGRSWVFLVSRRRSYKLPLIQHWRTAVRPGSHSEVVVPVWHWPPSARPSLLKKWAVFRQLLRVWRWGAECTPKEWGSGWSRQKGRLGRYSEEYRLWCFFRIALGKTTAPFLFLSTSLACLLSLTSLSSHKQPIALFGWPWSFVKLNEAVAPAHQASLWVK